MSTLKVNTVRPVTTDGSLTLQGDSSGSGVTGLVIDSTGTVTTGTLGSGVVFPAGIYKNFVQVTDSTQITENSTSYQDTGISAATINLSSTSSKVLIFLKCHLDTLNDYCAVTVYSDASGSYSNVITTGTNLSMLRIITPSSRSVVTLSGFFLHSPGVSGNVNYKIYLKSGTGNNVYIQGADETTCLGVAEVLG